VDPVTLETERLLLRAFAGADAESVYAACQDPDIQYYTPAPTPYLREDAEKYVGETAPQGMGHGLRPHPGRLPRRRAIVNAEPHDWWVGGLLRS